MFKYFKSKCFPRKEVYDIKKLPSYVPDVTKGVVIKVYDGDTITIAAKLKYWFSPTYKFQVRMNGIDCAELQTKNGCEKKHAIIARDALSKRIMDETVYLQNVGTDKYGRLLADVYYNGQNMCEWMLTNNYAVPYDGKTKQRSVAWDLPVCDLSKE